MNEFWQHCLSLFAKEIGQQQFVTWIQPLQCAVTGSRVTITAPNGFVQRWVRDRFQARILEIARDRLGSDASIDLVLAEHIVVALIGDGRRFRLERAIEETHFRSDR